MKKNLNRIFALLLVVAMMISCLAGCSKPADDKTTAAPDKTTAASGDNKTDAPTDTPTDAPTEAPEKDYKNVDFRIAWWGGDARHNKTIEMIEGFESNFKNLKIAVEYSGSGDFWGKLSNQAVGKNLPDVFQMTYARIREYADAGLLLPLDEYISSGAIDFSKTTEETMNAGIIDGKMYGIVTGSNIPVYYVDEGALKDAGVELSMTPTWDEFIAACKTMWDKKQMRVGDIILKDYVRMVGESYFSADGKSVGFTEETLVQFWTDYLDGMEYGYFPDAEEIAAEGSSDALYKGIAWCAPGYTNSFENAEAQSARPLNIVAYPHIPEHGPVSYMNPNTFWVVSATCENPELAVEYLNYWINEPKVYEILAMDRGVPVNSDIRGNIAAGLEGTAKEVMDAIEYLSDGHVTTIFPHEPAASAEATTEAMNYFAEVQHGILTRDKFAAAAKECIEKMNKILADGR